jgi:hypothetical protein
MNNIIQELESMRQRQIEMINADFDNLKCKLEHLGEDMETDEVREMFLTLPLRSGASIFKGKKPVEVNFGSYTVPAITWRQVVDVIFQEVIKSDDQKDALYKICDRVNGKTRTILSSDEHNMKSPLKIAENLYYETHYGTETLITVLTDRILKPIDYDYSRITITVRNN